LSAGRRTKMSLPQQCRHGVMKKFCEDCHPNLKQKRKPLENCKVYEAIGWTHTFCCSSLDNGIDPRTIEVPEMLEKAKKQLELEGD
jgi:hypothetical protein